MLAVCALFLCFSANGEASFPGSEIRTQKAIHITIFYPESQPGDTLILWQSGNLPFKLDYTNAGYPSTVAGRRGNGWFDFNIKTHLPVIYFFAGTMSRNKNYGSYSAVAKTLIPFYLAEAGDDVKIKIEWFKDVSKIDLFRNYKFTFSGRGSAKYRVRYEADSAAYYAGDTNPILSENGNYNPDNTETNKIKAALAILEKNKALMSLEAYYYLKTHILYSGKLTEITLLLGQANRNQERLGQDQAGSPYQSYLIAQQAESVDIPKIVLFNSCEYIPFLSKQITLNLLVKNKHVNADSLYHYIKVNTIGICRDELLTYFLMYDAYWLNNFSETLMDGLTLVNSRECREELLKLKTRTAGQKAYNFDLPDTTGRKVQLSSYKGKVVFVDFWFTGCSACMDFYKNQLSKVEEELKGDPNVVFMTICIDKGKDHWLKSIASGNYTSKSVINLFTEGQGAAHDVIKYYQVHTFPQPMIIGKDQRIYTFSNEKLRNAAGLKTILKQMLNK